MFHYNKTSRQISTHPITSNGQQTEQSLEIFDDNGLSFFILIQGKEVQLATCTEVTANYSWILQRLIMNPPLLV